MDLSTVDHLLTTTRTVRKRLDLERPVPREVIEECLRIAIQAPTGSNLQGWRFLVVTDPEKRRGLGELYRKAFAVYAQGAGARMAGLAEDDPRARRKGAVASSAVYLAEHMGRVPVLVVPCQEGRPEGQPLVTQAAWWGSILPATWSFMLALRARGLGTAWTTLHLMFEREAAELLGIPPGFSQAALIPVAWFTGDDFQPAWRVPAEQLTRWDTWGD